MQTSYVNSNFSARGKKFSRSTVSLTGCVSKLSFIEPQDDAYFAALTDYADHYAETQAYLAEAENFTAHDDSLIGNSPSEPDHGLLGDDGEPAVFAQISDDDIDRCGYLGWLRH